MRKAQSMIPVFYTRGVNAPYTEGHIQVIRMMIRSLSLYNVRSVIFNFTYSVDRSAIEDAHVSEQRIAQEIPLVSRDSLYEFSTPVAAYALSMETLKTLRFFLFEKTMKGAESVVNIVNCSHYPRMFLKRLSRVPVILHYYMPNIRSRPLTKILTERASLIIASSSTVSKHLEEIGVGNERIKVLYPPVDMKLYKPLGKKWARSKLNLPIEAKIVVYIGGLKRTRFPEETMLEIMKELWKEIPEAILLVCTSKDIENLERALEISRKIKAANLSRRILIRAKNLTDFEKTMIYNAADLFLLPHFGVKTAIEPPLTVLEAMACGTTVLVPETPSLSEIVADSKNGFVFRISDYYTLLKKLGSALMCQKSKARMAHDARHTIDQKASLLTTGAKMIEFFESVISR